MSHTCIEQLENRRMLSASHHVAPHAARPAPHQAARDSGPSRIGVSGPSDPAIARTALTADMVSTILAQAASQARPGQVITVTDRSGTILGVWEGSNVTTGDLPALEFLSAARARTGSAFESTQNAFTTRTARFIIQNHFPQPVKDTPGGPLYGVEFSNFPGSDILPSIGVTPGSGVIGLNTGLSGDPGGMPLFIRGIPVGGIGVAGDGNDQAPNADLKNVLEFELPTNVIALGNRLTALGDANDVSAGTQVLALGNSLRSYEKRAIANRIFTGAENADFDESVAEAGSVGFAPPALIRANQINVAGLTLPYAHSPRAHGNPTQTLAQLQAAGAGSLTTAPFLGFGTLTSTPTVLPGEPELNNFVLPVTPTKANNFLPGVVGQLRIRDAAAAQAAGVDIQGVPFADTPTLTGSTVAASDYQAPPTTPPSNDLADPSNLVQVSPAQTVVAGTPTTPGGEALTTQDVMTIMTHAVEQSLVERGGIRKPNGAKARIHVSVVDANGNVLGTFRMGDATNFSFDVAVQKARTAAYFSDNQHAFTATAIGFMSQMFFPPGINGGDTGPLYRLQDELLDDPYNQIRQAATVNPDGTVTPDKGPLPNGITDFPGGDPLYKNGVLVGAVGISGDGVVQDDEITYAGERGFRPPDGIRSDQLSGAQGSQTAQFLIGKVRNLATTYGVNLGNFDTTAAFHRLFNGLGQVHLPFAKFPRNPTNP